MRLYHPLEDVFHSWTHVAVLRTLLHTTVGKSGNQVARESGMHPLTALKALTALEELGIVRRQRGGRDHIFTLRQENMMVREAVLPLFTTEQEFERRVFAEILSVLPRSIVSATVFGSVARREEHTHSDLDLCCVVARASECEPLRERFDPLYDRLRTQYNVTLSPLILTVAEIARKSRSAVIVTLQKEGKVIAGKSIREVIRDHKEKAKAR